MVQVERPEHILERREEVTNSVPQVVDREETARGLHTEMENLGRK